MALSDLSGTTTGAETQGEHARSEQNEISSGEHAGGKADIAAAERDLEILRQAAAAKYRGPAGG